MSNEITKLYELAGVEQKEYGDCSWDCDCPYVDCEDIHCDNTCPYWKIERVEYPPFTAEKQIELIKWLAEWQDFYSIKDIEFNRFRFMCGMHTSEYLKTFEETLANLVNILWEFLEDEQREQIREILK